MKKEARKFYNEKINNFKDKKDRIFENPKYEVEDIKNIHISGACGKAMASIAGLFKQSGFEVSGSDSKCYPPMSLVLENIGLEYKDFGETNLKEKDLIVVGNVCSPDFEEPKFARENKITQISGAEALGKFFIKDKKSIVCCGTHGKTTTTSLMVDLFKTAQKEPGFLVGGVVEKYNTSYDTGSENTKYFISEGDEYDTAYFDKAPKFLHYKPYLSIITSVEFDHADIYKDFEEYKKAFKFLAEETKKYILISDEVECVDEITKNTEAEVFVYGFSEKSDFQILNLKQENEKQIFDLKFKNNVFENIEIKMPGKHNVLNAVSVFATGFLEKIDEHILRQVLKNFEGVKKRQEKIFENSDFLVFDDFAHHPTAVLKTLEGFKLKYPEKRIVCIFEPRSSTSRKKVFQEKYIEAFEFADLVYIKKPPFLANDNENDFFDINQLVEHIQSEKNKKSFAFENVDEILKSYNGEKEKGDLVVLMSNGDFENIGEEIKNILTI